MTSASLGPYSRASALMIKAIDLEVLGHYKRSDDKFREAFAAARAVGAEDCLVTAFLTVEAAAHTALSLARPINEGSAVPPDRPRVADAMRDIAESVVGAASVARRRRNAGTNRPAERAFHEAYCAVLWREASGCSRREALEPIKRKGLAPLCSETTVSAASALISVLNFATELAVFSASEVSIRLDAACDLVDEAVALAGPGKRAKGAILAYEGLLKENIRTSVEFRRQKSSTAGHASRLAEARKQLCPDNATSADTQAQYAERVDNICAKMSAARTAASAPEQLRRCALASCGAKEAHVSQYSKCAACKAVIYCSKACQLADWPAHKKACKAARKAADEAVNNA